MATLLGRHATVTRRRRGTHLGRAAPECLLAGADSAPKLMPAIVIGIFSSSAFLAYRVPRVTFVSQRSR